MANRARRDQFRLCDPAVLIHRYWDTDEPPGLCDASVFAGCEVRDWTRSTVPFDLPDTDVDGPRHRSNLARYRLLAKFGGLYVDHDAWPTSRFAACGFLDTPWVSTYRRFPCGALLGGGPSAVWEQAYELACGRPEGPAPLRSGRVILEQLVKLRLVLPVDNLLTLYGEPGGIVEHQWVSSTAKLEVPYP